jgi:hypothetical protein
VLGVLEEELDQPEDREQGIVDLVGDAGRELADRSQLAALEQLLLELPALAPVGDVRQIRERPSAAVAEEGLPDLDRVERSFILS